jgi:hypothetical protein
MDQPMRGNRPSIFQNPKEGWRERLATVFFGRMFGPTPEMASNVSKLVCRAPVLSGCVTKIDGDEVIEGTI